MASTERTPRDVSNIDPVSKRRSLMPWLHVSVLLHRNLCFERVVQTGE